jgi:PKD repeat protein
MTAKDMNNGCSKDATIAVTLAPGAAFAHTVSNGSATFSNTSTGSGPGSVYFWDFGDGSSSLAQHPNHSYQNAGSHLVKLRVTNTGTLCVDSVIQSVNVTGVPCTANSNFSLAPTNTAQVWNAIPAYPWNISAASWDWGDNSTSNTLYTSHQYSAAGLYNICLSVTVSCVASSSSCASYSVYRSSQPVNIIQVNVINPELISGMPVAAAEMPPSLQVIPNPNAGDFLLSVQGMRSGYAQFTICDLMGRLVHSGEIITGEPIQVKTEGLTDGVYFVTIRTGESTFTTKMVLQR